MPVAMLAGNIQDTVLSGPIIAALLVAALAGLISFFSPCCLPLVPAYLGYVSGLANDGPAENSKGGVGRSVAVRQRTAASRTVLGAGLFVLGFSGVFTAYGAAFGEIGRQLTLHQDALLRISGALTVLMGLVFMGAMGKIPLLNRTYKPSFAPRVGLAGAPLLGGMFAVGWTPCIGPTLAAVLTLSTTSATASRGALLTFAYSMGLGLPFLVAAASYGRANQTFAWVRHHQGLIARLGGTFLVLVGLAQLSGVWSTGMAQLQGLITGWQTPL
ncbi:cytochrome c biogenesis CcdA family protein [Nocardioides sp. T2.26MG-1]|uniref:cytochrome c biogenesis CcdA family protein n=1 Tax=Nocardioides sp. T2.26MG-1 TaxID=3041166 RepID=UPI0024774342|nr:cytochrome c biogenesis protein CcdA [Nocardioides sp. T2.26MG-1]CAI9419311.1 Protein DipZ [Nocardioides sp. T2.26MG-1]